MPSRTIASVRLASGPIVALALLVSACAADPPPSILHAHGDPLAVNAPPNRVACDARFRAETEAARRIRAEVTFLPADDAAIASAAADPASTTDLLGIPLTVIERNMVRASDLGLGDWMALHYWVRIGAPERFGGMWIDPPGTNQRVVAIVGGDPDTIGLAQCLGPVGARFVWADLSLTDGHAIADRIAADAPALRARGFEIHSTSYEEDKGVVVIGVSEILPGLEKELADRYGAPVRVEIQPRGEPLGRHGAART